jgi:hypothetical protein
MRTRIQTNTHNQPTRTSGRARHKRIIRAVHKTDLYPPRSTAQQRLASPHRDHVGAQVLRPDGCQHCVQTQTQGRTVGPTPQHKQQPGTLACRAAIPPPQRRKRFLLFCAQSIMHSEGSIPWVSGSSSQVPAKLGPCWAVLCSMKRLERPLCRRRWRYRPRQLHSPVCVALHSSTFATLQRARLLHSARWRAGVLRRRLGAVPWLAGVYPSFRLAQRRNWLICL